MLIHLGIDRKSGFTYYKYLKVIMTVTLWKCVIFLSEDTEKQQENIFFYKSMFKVSNSLPLCHIVDDKWILSEKFTCWKDDSWFGFWMDFLFSWFEHSFAARDKSPCVFCDLFIQLPLQQLLWRTVAFFIRWFVKQIYLLAFLLMCSSAWLSPSPLYILVNLI